MNNPRRRTAPAIGDHDRLSMTFLLASVLHGMLILGITFSHPSRAPDPDSGSMDIVLLQPVATPLQQVKDARYLSQQNREGGGETDLDRRQQDLFSAPTLSDQAGIAPRAEQQAQRRKQSHSRSQHHFARSDYRLPETPANQDEQPQDARQTVLLRQPVARLAAELDDTVNDHAQSGKTRFLNSSTREYIPARYMREWIDRVERIGNLNYPDQARRRKLNGTLILDVVIDASGRLIKTDLRQSSGHQVLDDAARRIVRLAAPFPPFPEKLRQQADVIHITRSWEFLDESGLRTR